LVLKRIDELIVEVVLVQQQFTLLLEGLCIVDQFLKVLIVRIPSERSVDFGSSRQILNVLCPVPLKLLL
jgi:hypothetical protein